MASEEGVQATNDDAAQCKRFAVERGYWNDPYVSLLTNRPKKRHDPEISRGYYARVTVMRNTIKDFIRKTNHRCQVVSLGAGFDTTYWLLKDEELAPASYVEVDFSMVTGRKCELMQRNKALIEKLLPKDDSENGGITIDKEEVHSKDYHLVSCNLTNIALLDTKLTACGLDKSLPTLFMAECVLVYIPSASTNSLMKWIADNFKSVLFLNYEMVNMKDRFGEVMIDNLKKRQCDLVGVDACTSLDTQKQRFVGNGFEGADGMTMSQIYNFLPQADIQRIERIEFMDECELLEQLLQHYCVVWGWIDSDNVQLGNINFS